MKKQLAGIFAALSTAIAAPALANNDQVFYTNPELITETMARTGCEPMPEKFEFERGKSWEEQTIPMPQQWTRSALVWYCKQNHELLSEIEGDTPIGEILEQSLTQGVHALRALPEDQRERADELFREIAGELARAALDMAFEDNLHKHRALPGYYRELSDILDQIQETGNNLRALDPLHQRAYDINMEMQRRGFKNEYVYAANAVALAGAVGTPPDLMLDPEIPSENAAWVALNETRMMAYSVFMRLSENGYKNQPYYKAQEYIADEVREFFDAPEFGLE